MIYNTEFGCRDRVCVDGKMWKVFFVTAITIRGDNIVYEVSGMEDGNPSYFVIEDWRLTKAENE